MSDGSDSIFHRPIQRQAAISETLPPSVPSPREILALCFSTFHNSACPKYTLSPIMSTDLREPVASFTHRDDCEAETVSWVTRSGDRYLLIDGKGELVRERKSLFDVLNETVHPLCQYE